jgi:hypothetical protein
MPPHTWTSTALVSSVRPLSERLWRIVEAQHASSTLKLVDSLEEQEALERIIEETEPTLPEECEPLHRLLSGPFRHRSYPQGSRFRRAGMTAGVFYASEAVETAIAEAAFYRLIFYADSPGTPWSLNASEHTAFSVRCGTPHGVDLMALPLVADRASWTALQDYGPCQQLADDTRNGGLEAIRYESVRDPARRANLAVLTCHAFEEAAPFETETWTLRPGSHGVQAIGGGLGRNRLEFDRTVFAADPRIASLVWDR